MAETMIQASIHNFRSKAFRTSLVLILAAEAVLIACALLTLNTGIDRWIKQRTAQAMSISQAAASSADWSQVGTIATNGTSPLFKRYDKLVSVVSKRYFKNYEGEVFVAWIKRGEEFDVEPDQDKPTDGGIANKAERDAYSSGRPTVTADPISDQGGTYLAAYTPVLSNGKVVALIAVEFDSATLADFRGIVWSSVQWSILWGTIISLIASYVLAGRLTEPTEFVKEIEDERQRSSDAPSPAADVFAPLSDREIDIVDLVGRGYTAPQIAEQVHLSRHTVHDYLADIREKTGLRGRNQLLVAAAARRARS